MPNFKSISARLPDLWFYIVAATIILLAGMIVYANAATGVRTDPFVRMIERRLSGDAHMNIGPGVMVSSPECGCTIKYLGTKIEGHVYAVYLDKMD